MPILADALQDAGCENDDILAHCEKRLHIHAGETTKDGKVTLRTAECLASCGTAPVMMVNDDFYEGVSHAKADEICAKCK